MIRTLNMNLEELESIMQIWLRATIKAHPFISEKYWNDNYALVKEVYIPNSKTYVYVENETVKGFISILNDAYIGAVFVDTKFQGQGIGKKLIDHVKSTYRYLELAVYKENIKSVAFYKKSGFSILEERPNEETKQNEYLMAYRTLKL